MKRIMTLLGLCTLLLVSSNVFADVNTQSAKNILLVKNMFLNFSEKRDIDQLDKYYSKDFILVSNHKVYDYQTYKKQQAEIFKTIRRLPIIHFDDIFSCGDKVVARMTFKLTQKTGQTYTFYEILITRIKHDKIDRMWEVTYPAWDDKLPTGQS